MAENTRQLLNECVSSLAGAGVQTWVFCGWAEELRGIRPSRPHKDIDLLYPAGDFSLLERFIAERGYEEVVAKRFVHKRAFLWNGVLVEVFLLQPGLTGYFTNFFGLYQFAWPADTLTEDMQFPIASKTALCLYRERHEQVDDAGRRYLNAG